MSEKRETVSEVLGSFTTPSIFDTDRTYTLAEFKKQIDAIHRKVDRYKELVVTKAESKGKEGRLVIYRDSHRTTLYVDREETDQEAKERLAREARQVEEKQRHAKLLRRSTARRVIAEDPELVKELLQDYQNELGE